MKLSRIDAYLTRIPFRKPYRFSDKLLEEMETIFVRLEDTEGNCGWGEVFPGNKPTLTAAWSVGVFHVLKDCLIPLLGAGMSINSSEHLNELLEGVRGNRHAKGVLDLAYWDLYSKRLGKPVHETIGGTKKEVEIGLVFDRFDDVPPLLDELARAHSEGYKRITLKMRPGWDLQILGIVRSEYPTSMLQCDIEGALTLERNSELLYRFDDFSPTLLEQPLSNSEYVGHAMLQDAMRTSIGLDESITTLHQAQIAIDLQSSDTFCIKPGKVGGLTEAKAIHAACGASDIALYAGCDVLTSVGYRFVAALASLANFSLPADYLRLDEILLADPGIQLNPVLKPDANENNRLVLELWNEPGIGFEPDIDLIEKMTIAKYSWPGI